jgi:hypothetical protein
MSAPVPEQAILGPLIYAPPWARRQPPAGEADVGREDRLEPSAGEPLGLPNSDTSFAQQPSASFEDDFAVMTLEECLALAPEQGTDAPEPMAEPEPPQWRGTAWPVLTRLACTVLLALAGALGFRWLSVAPAEPREGQLVVQESFAQEPAALATVTTLKADREPQPVPPLWSLDLMLSAGTGHDPGRQLTMSAAAAPAPAGGTTAAAVISTGPAHRASHTPGSPGNGFGARATMVRAGSSDENR